MILSSALSSYKLKIDYFSFPSKLELMYFMDLKGSPITEIKITDTDIVHAAFTCGMPSFWINSKKIRIKRQEELNYKLHLIRTALDVDAGGYITVSDRIQYMDASEKRFVSYFIGMLMTKLISVEIFRLDYLVHLGILSTYKRVVRGRCEPDLVGFCKGKDEYSIFEAKGRDYVRNNMVTDAKNQIASVVSIGGKIPKLGVVSVTHPIKAGSRLTCSLYDPDVDGNLLQDISKGELLYLYYLPIFEFISEIGNGNALGEYIIENVFEKDIHMNVRIPDAIFEYYIKNSKQYQEDYSELVTIVKECVADQKLGAVDDMISLSLG